MSWLITERDEFMNKILTIGLIGILAALIAGSIYAPAEPLMWLASTSQHYVIMRVVLIVSLAILLFTKPPRSPIIRIGLGTLSFMLATWTLDEAYNNMIHLWDALVFLQTAIILAIESLELPKQPATKAA